MRRVWAWLLVLAGLAGVVAGTLLATVLRPPAELTAAVALEDPGAAVASVPGLLQLTGPDVRVDARGPAGTDVFLGVAREAEAAAWLADVRRTEVTGLTGGSRDPVLAVRDAGAEQAAADPRQADIWLAAATGAGGATLTWPRREGAFALVAATDGVAPAPAELRMTWTRTGAAASHPGARPLVVAGGAAVLLGMALLTLRRDRPPPPVRRGRGASRGAAGTGGRAGT